MKFLYIVLLVILSTDITFSQNPDSTKSSININFGGNIGVGSQITPFWDIYGGAIIPFDSAGYAEANIGYLSGTGTTSYGPVDDLEYNLRAVYLDANYHTSIGLFFGANIGFSFNSVEQEEQDKFERFTTDSPSFFIGSVLQGNLGYSMQVNNRFALRFLGRAGIHNFEIAEGDYWQLGGTDPSFITEDLQINTELIYSITIGASYVLITDW